MRPRTPRRLLTWLLLAGTLALPLPAAALASGGSAGDQQYTDPFAGTSPTTATHPGTAAQTTTGTSSSYQTSSTPPATASTPPATASTPATSSTPPATTSPPPTSAAPAPTSSTVPTATIAHGRLPYTGYESWLAGALGFTLAAAGVVVRLRLRRS